MSAKYDIALVYIYVCDQHYEIINLVIYPREFTAIKLNLQGGALESVIDFGS